MSVRLARSPMARSALVAAAALALAGGTAVSATAAQAPAAHGAKAAARDYRRVCAVTHRPGIAACLSLIRTNVRQHTEAFFNGAAPDPLSLPWIAAPLARLAAILADLAP